MKFWIWFVIFLLSNVTMTKFLKNSECKKFLAFFTVSFFSFFSFLLRIVLFYISLPLWNKYGIFHVFIFFFFDSMHSIIGLWGKYQMKNQDDIVMISHYRWQKFDVSLPSSLILLPFLIHSTSLSFSPQSCFSPPLIISDSLTLSAL